MVRDAFCTGSFPQDLAHTLIVLIPKEQNPTLVSHFRPISLVYVTWHTKF